MDAFLQARLGEDLARLINEYDGTKYTNFDKNVKPWFEPCRVCKKQKNVLYQRNPIRCCCWCMKCEECPLECKCEDPSFFTED